MVRRLAGVVFGWSGTLWVLILFLAWVGAHLWPPAWWFEVHRITVFDAPAHAEIILDVDREIHRSFTADWSALVRRRDREGWGIHCVGQGTGDYLTDAVLPDPLTLTWWTNGACSALPEGRYFVSTIWTIRGGPLPDKTVHVASNIFTVE